MYHKKLDQSKIAKIKKESGIEQFIIENSPQSINQSQPDTYLDNDKIMSVIDEIKAIVVGNLLIAQQISGAQDVKRQNRENTAQIYHSLVKSETILEELLNEICIFENEQNNTLFHQLHDFKQMIREAQIHIKGINVKKIAIFQKSIKEMISFVDKIYRELGKYILNTKKFIAVNIAQETIKSAQKSQVQSEYVFPQQRLSSILELKKTSVAHLSLVESV